jgi:hypothetical protein
MEEEGCAILREIFHEPKFLLGTPTDKGGREEKCSNLNGRMLQVKIISTQKITNNEGCFTPRITLEQKWLVTVADSK